MLYIYNVRALNPHTESLDPIELLIEGDQVVHSGLDLSKIAPTDCERLDGNGGLITPGLIDVHVHFRQPGGEAKETIQSGSHAAARGGFTTVCAMPNVNPVPDSVANFETIQAIIDQDAVIDVRHYATISKGLNSETDLVDYEGLKSAGAFAFTNDGVGVQTAGTMYQAMKQAAQLDMPIVAHTEDNSLLYGGVMHAGSRSEELDLPGMLALTESTQIARDILLAEATGCHYHVCHVSSAQSIRVIRDGQKAGVNVTCEVTPHHLLLIDEDIPGDDAQYKMNPPLRGAEDRQALIDGLLDGTIAMIATDHAPHTSEEKAKGFRGAPFGITGIETSFQLIYTHFVETGIFTLSQVLEWMVYAPARIFDLPVGGVEPGSLANLAIFDIDHTDTIREADFLSRSTNTPFTGWEIEGATIATIYQGRVVYHR